MTVMDSEGKEVVQLTGDKGGFDNLFVGVLSGENVVTKNYQGDLNYFVDVVSGSDLGDGSEAIPF